MNFIANLAMQLSHCHPESAAPQKKNIFRESKRNIFIFNLREIVYMVRITLKTIMSNSIKIVDLKRSLTQIIYTVQKFKCYYCFRLYRFLE